MTASAPRLLDEGLEPDVADLELVARVLDGEIERFQLCPT